MKCNVTACNREAFPLLIHKDNHKAYCPRCARNINEHNKPTILIPWPTQEQIRLAMQLLHELTGDDTQEAPCSTST